MHWYATLVNRKNLMLREYLNLIRESVLSMEDQDGDIAGGLSFYSYINEWLSDESSAHHHPEEMPNVDSVGGSDKGL